MSYTDVQLASISRFTQHFCGTLNAGENDSFEFDDSGNVTRAIINSGTTSIYDLDYDSKGNYKSVILDDDGNGTPEYYNTYEKGKPKYILCDRDENGVLEEVYKYDYDEDYRRTNQCRWNVEIPVGTSVEDLVLDEKDAISQETIAYNDNGISATCSYENGNLIRSNYYDENSTLIKEEYNEYDSNGNLVYKIIKDDSNGHYELSKSYKYDENNNKIETRVDKGNDGKDDEIYTYKYDKDGNLTGGRYDNTANNFGTWGMFTQWFGFVAHDKNLKPEECDLVNN